MYILNTKRFMLIIAVLFAISCSTSEKDYDGIRKLQDSKEQLMQQDIDYDVKMQTCNDVINALQGYLADHQKGKWHETAELALSSWQERKSSIIRQRDFSEVSKIQEVSEQTMKNTYDYDIKIQTCQNVINSLTSFLDKYRGQDLNAMTRTLSMSASGSSDFLGSLNTLLDSWKQRKSACENEFNTLKKRGYEMNLEKAKQRAQQQHLMSNIENIDLQDRQTRKEGNNFIIQDTYNIRMRGIIIGTSIFKFTVQVTSRIAMDTKNVFIDNEPIVVE